MNECTRLDFSYQTPTAIVRVHRPNLTPEEYARRMEAIRKAAVEMVIATQRNKRQKAMLAAQGGEHG